MSDLAPTPSQCPDLILYSTALIAPGEAVCFASCKSEIVACCLLLTDPRPTQGFWKSPKGAYRLLQSRWIVTNNNLEKGVLSQLIHMHFMIKRTRQDLNCILLPLPVSK